VIGNFVFTVAVLAVVLGVLVFVHELGHYMAAKAFGVWVHRFAIGIGKPIPGLTFKRGETEWAIAWLPLGGYVKMASRESEPASSVLEGGSADDVPADRVFEAKPIWQRMIIILSGVALNALFALLIFTGLAWKNGRHYDPTTTLGHVAADSLPSEAKAVASIPIGTRITAVNGHAIKAWDDIGEQITAGGSDQIVFTFDGRPDLVIELNRDALAQRAELAQAITPTQIPVLGTIGAGTPAQAAGLEVGDSIVAIDGAPVTWWADAVERIQPSAGKVLQIAVVRNGVERSFTVVPRAEHQVPEDAKSPMIGRIGVAAKTRYLAEPLSLGGAIKAGADASLSSAGTIFRTLRGLLNGRVATSQVGGPILIGQMAAQEARAGIEPLLAFIALISINLAVINLLPIPVLDGGAFLFLLVEGIIRRPLPVRVREVLSMAGLAIVVLLMVFAMKNDIFRLFGK
jgi:regulator of sigma E protease